MKLPFSFTPRFSEVAGKQTRNHVNRFTSLSCAVWVTLLKRGMNENYYRHLSLLQRIMPPQNLERPINWQSFDRVTTSGHSRGAKQ